MCVGQPLKKTFWHLCALLPIAFAWIYFTRCSFVWFPADTKCHFTLLWLANLCIFSRISLQYVCGQYIVNKMKNMHSSSLQRQFPACMPFCYMKRHSKASCHANLYSYCQTKSARLMRLIFPFINQTHTELNIYTH